MGESINMGISAGTPGADANTYSMFNSVTAFGGGLLRVRGGGGSRVTFSVDNSHAGTLKAYMSTDKGTTWKQVEGDIVVAAAGATDISGPYDFLVDTYPDFKLDWVNGGSAQTTWRPWVTMICGDRAVGA